MAVNYAFEIINMKQSMFQYFIHLPVSKSKNNSFNLKFKNFNEFSNKTQNNYIPLKNKSKILTKNHKKKVRFIEIPDIKLIYTWRFASTQARKNIWQHIAYDRIRFHKKIRRLSKIISPILTKKQHEIRKLLFIFPNFFSDTQKNR